LTLAFLLPGSPQWSEEDDEFIVRQLLATDPEFQPELRSMLVRRRDHVVAALVRAFADNQSEESHRLSAARALGFFLQKDASRLASVVSTATAGQYDILFPILAELRSQHVECVLADIAAELPPSGLSERRRVEWGRRRAGAAISLLRLGEVGRSHAAFEFQNDPESLTQFVHRCRDYGVTATELVNSLQSTKDVRSRYAILLTLGDYSLDEIHTSQREGMIEGLVEAYGSDPSSAIHGAIVFYPDEYLMGSAENDHSHSPDERPHRIRLSRAFAVSSREITWQQFDSFDGGWHRREWQQQFGRAVTSESAAFGVSWPEAVQYCRFLTTNAGLPESEQYYGDPRVLPKDVAGPPLQQMVHLERHGFRLLTEAEWEYACRSRMLTTFSSGNDPTLLAHYAWMEET
jgi:hypothetical protein